MPRAAEARAILAALAPETLVYLDDHFTPEQVNAWPEHHSTITRGREQSFADYLHAQQAVASMRQEIVAVLHDVDDNPYLAVSLYGLPDEDLRIAHGRFLYFMPDEVEPYEAEAAP